MTIIQGLVGRVCGYYNIYKYIENYQYLILKLMMI